MRIPYIFSHWLVKVPQAGMGSQRACLSWTLLLLLHSCTPELTAAITLEAFLSEAACLE